MVPINNFKTKIFAIIAIGYLFSNVILVSSNIIANFPPADGIILSNGKVIGGDFIAFYAAGKLSISDKSNLYNFSSQKKKRLEILGHAAEAIQELPFVYPPLIAWFFSWFTFFNLDTAFYIWVLSSLVISIGCLLLLSQFLGLSNLRALFFILLGIFGFIPYYINCLMGGQLAVFGILIYALMFILLQEGKDFYAGLVLSLGYYKPPLFLFFAVALILLRGKHFLFGCLTGAIAFTILTILYSGLSGFVTYLTVASIYTYGQELLEGLQLPPESGMGIFALITTITPSIIFSLAVYASCFIVLLFITIRYLRLLKLNNDLFGLAYVFAVTASIALSLQLIKYDLSILLVSFMILFSKYGLLNKYKISIATTIGLFYLEWLFRQITLFGLVLNLSSFLFILILIFLFLSLELCNSDVAREKS